MSFNPGGGGGVSSATDVALSNPANNESFVYDSTTQKWKNAAVTKTQVGLSNVDNTSDASKPISTATATALNARMVWRGDFASTTAYAINDIIVANNATYRCRTAHTSGANGPDEDGDPTYWERTGSITGGVGSEWNLRPVIYATGLSTWPSGRPVPAGYTGPVTWDSLAYPGHPDPTSMLAGDDWLRRLS